MSKRNREISLINDPVKKRNAKSKRIKHILKKVQELSILCNLQMNFSIFDPSINNLLEYSTDQRYIIRKLDAMIVGAVGG